MTHEACQERLLDLAYGELGPGEAAEVQAHLAGCEACRAEHACLQGTRAIMRRLEPEPPPAHGEHLVLTAAREAAKRSRRRGLLPPRVWQLSLAAAALAVVGTVSFRVLSLREGERAQDIEGRPESFAAKESVPSLPQGERAVARGPDREARAPHPAPLPPSGETEQGAVAPAPESAAATERPVPPKMKAEEAPQLARKAAKKMEKKAAATPVEAANSPAEPKSFAKADSARERMASRGENGDGFKRASPASDLGAAEPSRPPAPAALPKGSARALAFERRKEVVAQSSGEVAASPTEAPEPPSPSEPAHPRAQAPPAAAEVPSTPPEEAEAVPAPEEQPPAPLLSSRTWKKDRRVRAIQKLVREIEEAQHRRRLVESARPFQACGPGEDAERRLYALDGRTVKYVRQVGSPEVALTLEEIYDGQGRLRYVFIHGGAVNGAVLEHRIWLDEDGQRLWEAQRWRRGRYPLPSVWPQRDLTLRAPDVSALQCGAP